SECVRIVYSSVIKILAQRPNSRLGLINTHEDPDVGERSCNIVVRADEPSRGVSIIEEATRMGVKHFVHYSFPRHMSQPLMAQRRDIMKQECEKHGIQFHFVTAPAP